MPLPNGTTVYSKRPFNGDFAKLLEWLPRELNIIDRAIKDTVVRSVTTVTANYDVLLVDDTVLGDATAGAVAVTLPLAVNAAGQKFAVKKVDASGNAVTVTAQSGELIDGAGTFPLAAQYDVVVVVSDGTAWHVLSS